MLACSSPKVFDSAVPQGQGAKSMGSQRVRHVCASEQPPPGLPFLPVSICKAHFLGVHVFAQVFLAEPPPGRPSRVASALTLAPFRGHSHYLVLY